MLMRGWRANRRFANGSVPSQASSSAAYVSPIRRAIVARLIDPSAPPDIVALRLTPSNCAAGRHGHDFHCIEAWHAGKAVIPLRRNRVGTSEWLGHQVMKTSLQASSGTRPGTREQRSRRGHNLERQASLPRAPIAPCLDQTSESDCVRGHGLLDNLFLVAHANEQACRKRSMFSGVLTPLARRRMRLA